MSTCCRKVRTAPSHLFHCIEQAGAQEVGISSCQSESNPIPSGHTHTHTRTHTHTHTRASSPSPTPCQPFTPIYLYQRLPLQEDLNTTHTKKQDMAAVRNSLPWWKNPGHWASAYYHEYLALELSEKCINGTWSLEEMKFSQLVYKFALLCVPRFRNNSQTILSIFSKHCSFHWRPSSRHFFKKVIRNIA